MTIAQLCEKFDMGMETKVVWYPHGQTVEYTFISGGADLPWVRLRVYYNAANDYVEPSLSIHNQLSVDNEIGLYPDAFAEYLRQFARVLAFTRALYSVDFKAEAEAVIRDAA